MDTIMTRTKAFDSANTLVEAILESILRQAMVPKLLKSGVLWTKFEVRGPRKWTSKINYICICDEKNAKKNS